MTVPTVHPDLRGLSRVLPRSPVSARTLPLIRRLERLARRRPPPAGVVVERVGAIDVRMHAPPGPHTGRLPALLWIHGGGYVMGLAASDDARCREYARSTGAVVAAVDYRTAPEHPWPTAVHDCHDALAWLASCPGIDPTRIAIGGASAGGGLAAALAHLAAERGEVQPVLQLLIYPMLDDRTALRTDLDESGYRLWRNTSNTFGWSSYLGVEPGTADLPATAVPARATDLAGLPAAWIGVGTLDLFYDEDVDYAERLRAAGVPCEVEIVDGAFHAFDAFARTAPVTQAFRTAQIEALTTAFAAATP